MAEAASISKSRFRFGLKDVLYAFALFGASFGLFGTWALLVAPWVLLFWWWNLTRRPPGSTLLESLVVHTIIAMLILLFVPVVSQSRSTPEYRMDRISLALHAYHGQYGCFPPAYVADRTGRPVHSWRVLILPQLGYEQLYKEYRFDEPWDGPNNVKLRDQMPYEFAMRRADNDRPYVTACLAVTGPETAWPGTVARRLDEITDDHSTTVILAECETRPVLWMAPQDVTAAEAARLWARPPDTIRGHWSNRFFWSTCQGRLATMADGEVYYGSPSSPDLVEEMAHVADNRPAPSVHELPEAWGKRRWRVLHYGNFARLAVFVVVALWPTFWLRKEMRRRNGEKE